MMKTMIEWAGLALLLIPFVYALFRAAGLGWYKGKYDYQRRLMNGLKQEL